MRKAVWSSLKIIEQSQPDIYVPNCIVPAYFAAGYARQQGVHTIGVLHSDDPFYWGIVDEFIKGKPAFRLSAAVTVSKFLQDATAAPTRQNKILTRRIGCGVPLPNEIAQRSDGVFRLIYSGRLEEEQKCISKVTHSLCAAVKQNPGVEAWIAGEGNARNNVEQVIHASGVDPRSVKLLGRVAPAEIYSLLNQCHALVLLSDYEGLPVSMLEAMAAGVVPVCLNMRSGIQEAIQPGVNGLIVKDRGGDFLSAIQSLRVNEALWTKLSTNARETVKREFSEDICAAAWGELLRSFAPRPSGCIVKMPTSIRLPRRNPKFGIYDQRLALLSRLRMTLGYYRRRLVRVAGCGLL